MIRAGDIALKAAWRERFAGLPAPARAALRAALLDLRRDALRRAALQWQRHKAPMAFYWKVVGVYAGHLARALRVRGQDRAHSLPQGSRAPMLHATDGH